MNSWHDPKSLRALFHGYQNWLRIRNYSPLTLARVKSQLGQFITWCEDLDMDHASKVTLSHLNAYKRRISVKRSLTGKTYSNGTILIHLGTIKAFFKWMVRQEHLPVDPSTNLQMPRREHKLPKNVLSPLQVETLLNKADVETDEGLLIRCALEVLWSTGIRRAELCRLKRSDIDQTKGILLIRQGKGGHDRLVPIGDRALAWIEKFNFHVRSKRNAFDDNGFLLISRKGTPFTPHAFGCLLRRFFHALALPRGTGAHALRHAFATALVNQDVSIFHIKELLGHASLSSSTVYTRVSTEKLKNVLKCNHPDRFLDVLE